MGWILPPGRDGGTLGAAFQGGLSMKTSTERILTTHTGSLPRPAGLADRHDPGAVQAAVRETVTRQREAGVDIVNDGEVSKPSYATYVIERLTGFAGEPVPLALRGFEEFPEFAQKMWGDPDTAAIMANPGCNGPVAYLDQSRSRPTSPTCWPLRTARPRSS